MVLKEKKKIKTGKNDNIYESIKCGFSGITYIGGKESHIRWAFLIIALGIIPSFLLEISAVEWVICIILSTIIITLEMVNTAIEKTLDIAMPNVHPLAKIAKDVAAGAVIFACIAAAISGFIIFLPKIIALF